MYSSLRLRTARSGHYPEFGGHPILGGGVNVQYEGQKTPVPEFASTIWSESAIRGSAIRVSTVFEYWLLVFKYYIILVWECNI